MFFIKKKFNFGTGCFPDERDVRDLKYEDIVGGEIKLTDEEWQKGFDIEKELNIKLPFKNQGVSLSCFHGSTPVLMEDFSYKPIVDVNIGDYVFTHKGNIKRVTNKFVKKWQGVTKRVNVWGDYRSIETTSEHPFFALKRINSGRYYEDDNGKNHYIKNENFYQNINQSFYPISELKETSKIKKEGDWLGFSFNNIVLDKTIHQCEKDPDFLWVLGLYLAEGSITKYGVVFSLHEKETDFYEKIKRTMMKYNINVSCYHKKESKSISVHLYGKYWSDLFLELGGKICNNKRLNNRLMFLDPHLQMEIVRGYSDGDGCERRSTNTMISTSYELLLQMRTILLRSGIYSSFCKHKTVDGKLPAWTLEMNINNKRRYHFIKDNYCFVAIKKIEHIKSYTSGSVYNLEVEDDNSYIVNGIAVHNCNGQAWAYYTAVVNAVEEKEYKEVSAKGIYSQIFLPQGGSMLRDGGKLISSWGALQENFLSSYNSGQTPSEDYIRDLLWKNKKADDTAKILRARDYMMITGITIDSVANAIKNNWGVVGGLYGQNNGTWSSNEPKPPTSNDWGHAVFFGKFGIDRLGKWVSTPNSWGTRNAKDDLHPDDWQKLREDYFTSDLMFNPWTLVDQPNYVGAISDEVKRLIAINDRKIIVEVEGVGRKGVIIGDKLREIKNDRVANAAIYVLTNNGFGQNVTTSVFDEIPKDVNF